MGWSKVVSEWVPLNDVVREFVRSSWRCRFLFYRERVRLKLAIWWHRLRGRKP